MSHYENAPIECPKFGVQWYLVGRLPSPKGRQVPVERRRVHEQRIVLEWRSELTIQGSNGKKTKESPHNKKTLFVPATGLAAGALACDRAEMDILLSDMEGPARLGRGLGAETVGVGAGGAAAGGAACLMTRSGGPFKDIRLFLSAGGA